MKKLLIFDAYGTLISTGNGSIQATEKILALQDKHIDAKAFYKEWKQYHRRHLDEANTEVFLTEADIFTKDLKVLYEAYEIDRPFEMDVQIMLDSLENRIVFPDVNEAIGRLRQRYRVVIGSTTDTFPLLHNLEQNQLTFDAVYTSEMIQKYKPDAGFYQYILRREGCGPEDAVFIGDSLTDDIAGPKRLGIATVWVNRSAKPVASDAVKQDYTASSINEIEKLL